MKKLIAVVLLFTPLASMAVCIMPSPSADNQAGAAYRQCVDNEINMERMRQEQMRQQQEQMKQQEQMRQQQESNKQGQDRRYGY